MKKTGILNFNNTENLNTASLGGKAVSLIRLVRNGFLVPDGFVILADMFNEFLKENKLDSLISDLLSQVNPNDVKSIEKVSEQIQIIFYQNEMPSGTRGEILSNFRALKVEFVAVRSSATAEDSVHSAWAGQLESFLNTAEANLIDNIKKCWSSLFSPRALAYRAKNGMIDQSIVVAVVVQKMIDSEISGISFSINPLNNDLNQIVIEAGYGLGEAIVSGQITPDSYVIKKDNFDIESKNIVAQTRAITRKGWEQVGEDMQICQKISDDQIREVASVINKIEKIYGYPVDIEFAFQNNNLYLLQARPITTTTSNVIQNFDRELVNYAKSQMWGCFKNTKRKLLYASLWVMGIREKMTEIDEKIIANEDIDVNTISSRVLRVFNLNQPQLADEIISAHIGNSENILSYIEKDYQILKNAKTIVSNINKAIEIKNRDEILNNALEFIDLHAQMSAYEYFINGLAQRVYQNQDSKETKDLIEKVNKWRNDESIDNSAGILEEVVKCIFDEKDINIPAQKASEFLHINEFIGLLNDEISKNEIIKIISNREKYGYILLNFRDKKYQNKILDHRTKPETSEIEKLIYSIYGFVANQQVADSNEIKGQSVFIKNEIICGECVVVPQEKDLNSELNIDGKILVTTMTTPEFIPYINNVKGIITDNGGLICHAAIIAREFGIPCIIGTEVATNMFKSGDVAEINLEKGTAKLV